MAQWLESRTCNLKVTGSRLGTAEIVGGGVNIEHSLLLQYHAWGETLEQGTEPPNVPRVPQHWLPTAPVVCAHGLFKCRPKIPSMDHHTWPHITSLHNLWFNATLLKKNITLYFLILPKTDHISHGITFSTKLWSSTTVFQHS